MPEPEHIAPQDVTTPWWENKELLPHALPVETIRSDATPGKGGLSGYYLARLDRGQIGGR